MSRLVTRFTWIVATASTFPSSGMQSVCSYWIRSRTWGQSTYLGHSGVLTSREPVDPRKAAGFYREEGKADSMYQQTSRFVSEYNQPDMSQLSQGMGQNLPVQSYQQMPQAVSTYGNIERDFKTVAFPANDQITYTSTPGNFLPSSREDTDCSFRFSFRFNPDPTGFGHCPTGFGHCPTGFRHCPTCFRHCPTCSWFPPELVIRIGDQGGKHVTITLGKKRLAGFERMIDPELTEKLVIGISLVVTSMEERSSG